ncbi:MAG: methyltransferase domain-containing protein [Victivallales bacterium]|nr:methyltransferase domain-containing protein [Victivallales bacterium]
MNYHESVRDYYEKSLWLYRRHWDNSDSLSMHFGFWEKDTRNIHQAFLNENQAVIDAGQITSAQKVLDAGCGIGGTSIYIAEKTGAKVFGVSLEPLLIRHANRNAERHNVAGLCDFLVGDYCRLPFPDGYFDIVFGIESICHCSPKILFLSEAYRILKPQGKLIIADAYLAREPENEEESQVIETFKKAYNLKEFISVKLMEDAIAEAGLVITSRQSVIHKIKQSLEVTDPLRRRVAWLMPVISRIPLETCQIIHRNYLGGASSYLGIQLGLADYFLHACRKKL